MDSFALRNLTETDLPGADELRRLSGWNQTLKDWRRMLSLEPDGCFVAVEDARVVGTVTAITYGDALAWIGMMLVHPERQKRGIGSALMRHAIRYLESRSVRCIKLDATPAGKPVYEKLGFDVEVTLTRCQRPVPLESPGSAAAKVEHASSQTRELNESDWPAIKFLDADAFGAPRLRLLRQLAKESVAARVCPSDGPIQGYGMIRGGATSDYLGPIVVADTAGANALLQDLLTYSGKRPVTWDVSDANVIATAAANDLGFVSLRPLTRMRLGPSPARGSLAKQLAIADPALG
jgi:GNAT superfamily N-acetyltransferase